MKDLSYQLYSSRNFPPMENVLKRVASAGYSQVEGYGAMFAEGADIDGLKAALDINGLHMASAHMGLDMLEADGAAALAIARKLDIQAIYCPFVMPEDRPKDADGWREFGKRVQAAGAPLMDAGLTYGWHNHDFEFVTLPDGTIPQTAMFEGGPDLSWEVDVAWIVRGGADPLAWFRDYSGRITALHVKDIAPAGENEDEDGWADVGHGTVDWPGLLEAAKATSARLFVVEHDNPADDARFAQRSIASLMPKEGK